MDWFMWVLVTWFGLGTLGKILVLGEGPKMVRVQPLELGLGALWRLALLFGILIHEGVL